MGQLYTATFSGIAQIAQGDLFELLAPTAHSVIIHEIRIGQTSEVADAQEEQLLIVLKSGQTTSGNGVAVTPRPVIAATGPAYASGGAVERIIVTGTTPVKASGGTIFTHDEEPWNIRAPYLWLPTDKPRIELAAGRRFTVELASTPDDSITFVGTIKFEQIG